MQLSKSTLLSVAAMAAFLAAPWFTFAAAESQKISKVEQVPFKHGLGQQKYVAMCAQCHGAWLRGTDNGPPLLHGYYVPSHHGDRAFYRAIMRGSQQHHWDFGDMPAVAGTSQQDAQQIVEFVRWVQKAEELY